MTLRVPKLDPSVKKQRDYADKLLNDQQYRDNLLVRLRAGMCAPALEVLLHHWYLGKPIEEVHLHTSSDVDEMTDEQIKARIAEIHAKVQQDIVH